MKIAFATTDGNNVDEHFGRAGMFAIYEYRENGFHFSEMRKFGDGTDKTVTDTKDQGPLHDSAVERKVDRLADCKLIYITEIGGPSAARLVKKGIMPMKVKTLLPISSAISMLDEMLKKSPPPWLKKLMARSS